MFLILSFILALSCSMITIRVLVCYNPEIMASVKWGIGAVVVAAWYAPVIIGLARKAGVTGVPYVLLSQVLYFMFGTAFILFCLIMLRDIFWIWGYKAAGWLGKASAACDPMNAALLKKANIATCLLAAAVSLYSLYQGVKFPAVKAVQIASEKIDYPFKIVLVSDLHINPAMPVKRVRKIVETVNALKPDVIVLPGDIVDAKPDEIAEQTAELAKLNAKYGAFVTLGNHEFYVGASAWENRFRDLRLFYLRNEGLMLNCANVYVAGIPDPHALRITPALMEKIGELLAKKSPQAFTLLMSHSPSIANKLSKEQVDLQVSGHTHGGQIFPFHFLVKKANGFLSGLYDVNGFKLYISNGAGGWGPPMRLFAPSEISEITLVPSAGF